MKNAELILFGLVVAFAMAAILAIYEVVNKTQTPSEWVIVAATSSYIIIHILNNWA